MVITCLLVNEPGAFMVYKINNTETDEVVPKVGDKITQGDYSYTTVRAFCDHIPRCTCSVGFCTEKRLKITGKVSRHLVK